MSMALINCPECGTKVDPFAPSCPQCGAPINSLHEPENDDRRRAEIDETRKKLRWHSLGSILLVLIGGLVLLAETNIAQEEQKGFLRLALSAIGIACFLGGITWSYITRIRKKLLEQPDH
ncbi:zinc ribbon domain-containing protein [Thioalkalivibrio thiocyanodenitrificans]|uniref:zinc ribbon domain-containing protein n=1 Tax=Thioalkalivibrio thiocyanodenitrificans TaxID=243063 RepID=UPI0018DE7A0F|nr:zinc-ribbon domain-containing protein [Thioalkalivibrio thiocyanodenitrificans]